jgi:D-glycerate 3-kinase
LHDAYAEIADWCAARAGGTRPLVVGINGPQGSGKSTLAAKLARVLAARGMRGVAVSIDDFYLTHAEQRALAARHPGDRTLEHRGYPGTHDVELGRVTLEALRRGSAAIVPVYDKSAHGGRGDRAPETTFRRVDPPLDFVLFEGWMLAFEPLPEDGLSPELLPSNRFLRAYEAWDELLDCLVRIEVPSLDDVVRFRVDSERVRRQRGETALSDEEARDYVERFLPAYRAWLPGLAKRRFSKGALVVRVDAERHPIEVLDQSERRYSTR